MDSCDAIASDDGVLLLLTTLEAAEHLEVGISEIEGWVADGSLKPRHRPSNNERVFRVFDLIAACHCLKHKLPHNLAHYGRRVLITEDDQSMARAIERVLRGAGYTTLIAPDGFQASAVVEAFCPALIILDLNMPQMQGLEVLTHLRSHAEYSHIKIIVVSAAPPDQLAEASAAGADRVVEKPYDNEWLLQVVSDLLAE